MKKKPRNPLLILAFLSLLLATCSNGKKIQEGPAPTTATIGPVIASEKTEYDWGKVKEGEIVEHIFKFVNKGDGILEIKKATGS